MFALVTNCFKNGDNARLGEKFLNKMKNLVEGYTSLGEAGTRAPMRDIIQSNKIPERIQRSIFKAF